MNNMNVVNILQIDTDGSFRTSFCKSIRASGEHIDKVLREQGHDMRNWSRDIITAKPMNYESWMVYHNCWDATPNAKAHKLFKGAKGPMFAFIEHTKECRMTWFNNEREMMQRFYNDKVGACIQRQIDNPTPLQVTIKRVNGKYVVRVVDAIELES